MKTQAIKTLLQFLSLSIIISVASAQVIVPEVVLTEDDDPRPSDFIWKKFASGKKVDKNGLSYIITVFSNGNAGGNRYQVWGSDKVVDKKIIEMAIVDFMKTEPADLYIVGNEWDEGLDDIIKKVTLAHQTDAYFFHVMPKIKEASFIPDGQIRKKVIADALAKAEREAEQPGAGQPATRPVDKPEGGVKPQPEAEGRCP